MKTDQIIIQTATPSNAVYLAKLAEKTFQEEFAGLNQKDDFKNYVAESFTENLNPFGWVAGENIRGNAFYTKMQFNIFGSKTFALGSDIQDDHIFSKLLV